VVRRGAAADAALDGRRGAAASAGARQRRPRRRRARRGVPLLVGWLRPAILLPIGAISRLPAEFIEYAILHELLHVRRLDPLVRRVQLVTETLLFYHPALLFYHPAVWWISRVLTREREHCCDAAVVAITRRPVRYARALTELEAARVPCAPQALALDGGSLMSRIRRIIRDEPRSANRPVGLPLALALAMTAAVVIAGLAAVPSALADSERLSIAWLPDELRRWESQFAQAAERHGVDPGLLAIITLVESRGNPEAVSSRGSLGLMQIMPATGRRIAAERGMGDFSVERLRDPGVNVDFGAWYLARQLETFGEGASAERAVALAAAAYNGGPGQLRAHLEEGAPLSEETSRYREIVQRLWSEREASRSPTFEAIWSKRPSSH
jgi:soluble lytic murein transglycosylase-like protein